MFELDIPGELLVKVLEHCTSSFPDEACGILTGTESRVNRVYTMKNIDPSPVSYLMDPGEQLRIQKEMKVRNERMLAIYHSHPQSPAYPSAKDVQLAFYDDTVYLIVGLSVGKVNEIKAFTITEGNVREIDYRVVG